MELIKLSPPAILQLPQNDAGRYSDSFGEIADIVSLDLEDGRIC